MDVATIIGIGAAFGVVILSIFMEGSTPMSVILPAPMLLVIGGTIGAGLASTTMSDFIGAFAGSFVGAFIGELTIARAMRGDPGRVATGALVGRAVAAALKSALGLVVVLILLGAAIWSSRKNQS